MMSLQVHLAGFGQGSRWGQHLYSQLVGWGSQPGDLDRHPGVLGSQAAFLGSQCVLRVLGMLLVDMEGNIQLANSFLVGEHQFVCCVCPLFK